MPGMRTIAKQALITIAVIFALSLAKRSVPAVAGIIG